MNARIISLLAIVIVTGFLFLLVHLFKSKDNSRKSTQSGPWGFILLFLVGLALAFLGASRSGMAFPLRGLHFGLPGALKILVLVFLALLLMLVFHKKEGRWHRVGFLVIFALALVVVAGIFIWHPQVVNTWPLPEHEISYQNQIIDTSFTPAIWSDSIEQRFAADIYPSQSAAVRALGYEIAARIQKMRPHIIKELATESALTELIEDQSSWKLVKSIGEAMRDTIADKKVHLELGEVVANIPVDRLVNLARQADTRNSKGLVIKLVQDEHERYLLEELREVIVEEIDDCRCEIVRRSSEVDTDQGEMGIELEIETKDVEPTKPIIIEETRNYTKIVAGKYKLETNNDAGKIAARIFSANYERGAIEVRFVEKPWVENFADYLNRFTDTQQQWIRARSSQTCFSVEEAHQLSLRDAAERVGGYLDAWDIARPRSAPILPEDLLLSGMIADQFSQSFEGSEGKVWRQALLVDVSRPKIEQLVHYKKTTLAAQRRNVVFLGVSFLGMMGVICVLYALANAATKGYYSTVLRLFTVVLVIAAVTGLVLAIRII